MKKTFFALNLLCFVLTGCETHTSSHRGPKYSALIRDKSVRSELVILESQRVPNVRFAAVTLGRVCAALSAYDKDTQEFQNSAILDPSNSEFGDRIVNLEISNASLAEIYDRICESTGAVWWVDHYIYIAPKPPQK